LVNNTVKRIILALSSLVLLGAQPAPAAVDPYRVFAQARQVWISQHYPPYLTYRIAVTVVERGVQKASHYSATYDALHDRIYVDPVSDEERDNPHVPTGTNMTLEPKRNWMTLFKKHVGQAEEAVDFLGVPMLAPNYSFGIAPYVAPSVASQADQAALVAEIRRQFNDPIASGRTQELDKISSLREIGRVVSTNRDYTISFDGIEPLEGCTAYHLSLRPTHAPDRLRLRELWVDTQTFATCRLLSSGNFTNSGAPWLITFANVGDTQYIASESVATPIKVGLHTYDQATVSFEAITAQQFAARYPTRSIEPATNVLIEPPSAKL
jgi:hypothetical protein